MHLRAENNMSRGRSISLSEPPAQRYKYQISMSSAPKSNKNILGLYTTAVRSFVHDVWSPVGSVTLISIYPSPLITRFCTALGGGGVNTILSSTAVAQKIR